VAQPPPFRVVIPARYASTRLPGKPLLPLAGKPMIVHVAERALEAGAEEVIVATDDARIHDALANLPLRVEMTGAQHASGTERIAEVAARLGWADDAVVVNLQGDEPLIDPQLLRAAAAALAGQSRAEVATLCVPIREREEIFNPNAVKVVLDADGYALYFSRAPVPWDRARFVEGEFAPAARVWHRHIGLYAYTTGFLRRYVNWEASLLESVEALEQLRILWHGAAMRVLAVESAPPAGVDTVEDAVRAEKALFMRGRV
jgi:3-deoxy-manno-octulosonate cytidylyltransferase (CMP-KDO synthetase)